MRNWQTGKFQFTKWIRRIGAAGVLFFLVKGLLWMLVPFLVGYSLWNE